MYMLDANSTRVSHENRIPRNIISQPKVSRSKPIVNIIWFIIITITLVALFIMAGSKEVLNFLK